jgi:hypothetical protein
MRHWKALTKLYAMESFSRAFEMIIFLVFWILLDQPPTTSWHHFSTLDDTNAVVYETHMLDMKGSEHVGIEVIDEIPPPNFNPPLINPFDPLLI